MTKDPKELKQIEKMLREMREEMAIHPNVEDPTREHGPCLEAIILRYPLAELHAFVRGTIYGL